MSLNPANPLDSYSIYESIATIEESFGSSVGQILDVLPAATALMRFSTHMENAEVSHIESCLLVPFLAEHRRKMWYVLNDIVVPEVEEAYEHEEDYDW